MGGPITFHGYAVGGEMRDCIQNLCHFLMKGGRSNATARSILMGQDAHLTTVAVEMMQEARLFGSFPDWATLYAWKGIENDPDHPLAVKLKLAVPNFHEIVQFYEFEKQCEENRRLQHSIENSRHMWTAKHDFKLR